MTENPQDKIVLDDDAKQTLATAAIGPVKALIHNEAEKNRASADAYTKMAQQLSKLGARPQEFVTLQTAVVELLKIQRDAIWDRSRKRPLDRLIIDRVSGLFAAAGSLDYEGRNISRRSIPGILTAIGMMIGPEELEERRAECRRHLARHREGRNGVADWDVFHAIPEVVSVVDDVLIHMAPHFSKPEARVVWFGRVINDHLSPVDDFLFEGPNVRGWEINRRGVRMVLRGMFSGFVKKLKEERHLLDLQKRYNAEQLDALQALVVYLKGQ